MWAPISKVSFYKNPTSMGILELLEYSREAFKYSPSQSDLF